MLASLRLGPATRSDLARETNLSQPTTGKIVDDLVAAGVLRLAVKDGPAGPGRPGQVVKLDDVRPRFLAVQLGPSNTRLAPLTVAPPTTGDAWDEVIPTPASLKGWVAAVATAARPLLKPKPSAIIVSVPGVLDERTGRTLLSPNARWMEGEAVARALSDELGLPAYPVQEIRCLALGHRVADVTAGDFLLVDFGIGVGSAMMVGGHLLGGGQPFSGELGHTPVPGNTAVCGCGGIGCLETLVGRRELLGDGEDDADAPTATAATRLAEGKRSKRLRSAMGSAGLGVAAAMNVLGLDHAVITGFVADLPPDVFGVLREAVEKAAVMGRFGTVRTEGARRHRLAGMASVGIDQVIVPV